MATTEIERTIISVINETLDTGKKVMEKQVETTIIDYVDDDDDELSADLQKALFLNRMDAMGENRTGESFSTQAPQPESDFTVLSDIEVLSDREEEELVDFGEDEESVEARMAKEEINSTMILAKDDVLKHYKEIALCENILQIASDFFTYVRVCGVEHWKIIRAIKIFGGDSLIDEEVKFLNTFKIKNFSDLINEERVWKYIDQVVSFEHNLSLMDPIPDDEEERLAELAEMEKVKEEVQGLKLERLVHDTVTSELNSRISVLDEALKEKEEAVKNLINEKEALTINNAQLQEDVQKVATLFDEAQRAFTTSCLELQEMHEAYGEQKQMLSMLKDVQENLAKDS